MDCSDASAVATRPSRCRRTTEAGEVRELAEQSCKGGVGQQVLHHAIEIVHARPLARNHLAHEVEHDRDEAAHLVFRDRVAEDETEGLLHAVHDLCDVVAVERASREGTDLCELLRVETALDACRVDQEGHIFRLRQLVVPAELREAGGLVHHGLTVDVVVQLAALVHERVLVRDPAPWTVRVLLDADLVTPDGEVERVVRLVSSKHEDELVHTPAAIEAADDVTGPEGRNGALDGDALHEVLRIEVERNNVVSTHVDA